MIVIIAKQVIKEEYIEKYHEITAELVEKSRAEEGCVFYNSVQSQTDKRVHNFVECWKDQEAIDMHGATEHFQRIVPKLADMFDEEEVVTMYNVVH